MNAFQISFVEFLGLIRPFSIHPVPSGSHSGFYLESQIVALKVYRLIRCSLVVQRTSILSKSPDREMPLLIGCCVSLQNTFHQLPKIQVPLENVWLLRHNFMESSSLSPWLVSRSIFFVPKKTMMHKYRAWLWVCVCSSICHNEWFWDESKTGSFALLLLMKILWLWYIWREPSKQQGWGSSKQGLFIIFNRIMWFSEEPSCGSWRKLCYGVILSPRCGE